MKKIQRTIFMLIMMVAFVFAQNQEILKLQLEKSENNSKPQLIKAQIQINNAAPDGIFLALPAGLKTVVMSASLNGNKLWLINSEAKVDKNNVLGWYYKNNGIILQYNNTTTGQLDIELAPDSVRLNKFDQITLNVHQMKRTNEKLDVESTVMAQSNLIIKQNTQTDQE